MRSDTSVSEAEYTQRCRKVAHQLNGRLFGASLNKGFTCSISGISYEVAHPTLCLIESLNAELARHRTGGGLRERT